MSDPETDVTFEIKKTGNQVTYTSMSEWASVSTHYFSGIIASVDLTIVDVTIHGQSHSSHSKKSKFHEENGVRHLIAIGEEQDSLPGEGKQSVVAPDTTYFSFTTNTSMYFSRRKPSELHPSNA